MDFIDEAFSEECNLVCLQKGISGHSPFLDSSEVGKKTKSTFVASGPTLTSARQNFI